MCNIITLPLSAREIKTVTEHYLIAELWTAYDFETETQLDGTYDVSDFSDDTRKAASLEIWAFLEVLEDSGIAELPMSLEQLGHDFSLTRNHHGAGFWDRGYGELGERLTKLCQPFGSADVYVSDAGSLEIE